MFVEPVKKIAVTGANGFVGKALTTALSAQRYQQIVAITRTPTQFNDSSVENHCSIDSAPMKGIDILIHVAARVHVMKEKSADPLAAFRQVNVDGTLQVAASAAKAGVKRFIFISTAKVNGETTAPGKPFNEMDTANPQDPYAISKWEAEQGLSQIAQQTGMEMVIIRPPLVYGPGVKANFAALMRAAQRGIPLPFGSIHNARSLVGLDNLVNFICQCVSHPAAANQTFLISDGDDISTSKLVRVLARVSGAADRQIAVPVACLRWLGKLTGKSTSVERLCGNLQLDISKARTLLSWAPPFTLEEGIRRTVASKPVRR